MENPSDSETRPQYTVGPNWPEGARLPIPATRSG